MVKKKKKPKHILKIKKKEPSTLIRGKRMNKNPQREIEYSQFCGGKNMDCISKII